MRLQARRYAQLDSEGLEVGVPEVQEQGWEAIFDKPGALNLEIGLGKDAHVIDCAAARPTENFVGLEYSRKKLDKVMSKVVRRGGMPNLRVMRADAKQILGPLFPAGSLARAYILFPDPWPKKRHHKKRLVQLPFIEQLATRLVQGGRLEIRTDSYEYRDQIDAVLASSTLENLQGQGFSTSPMNPASHIPTLFESKFIDQGRVIHYFYYEQRQAPTSRERSS